MNTRLKGFTLVELIVIITLLVIMSGFGIYASMSYTDRADAKACEEQCAYAEAAAIYGLHHGKLLPTE